MARAALFVSLLLLLAGCQGPVGDLDALEEDIEAAGYEVVGLQHDTINRDFVFSIEATMPNGTPVQDDADTIAQIAWERYSGFFDQLRVTIDERLMLDVTDNELFARLGERPGVPTGDLATDGIARRLFLFLLVPAGFVLVGLVVLVYLSHRIKVGGGKL